MISPVVYRAVGSDQHLSYLLNKVAHIVFSPSALASRVNLLECGHVALYFLFICGDGGERRVLMMIRRCGKKRGHQNDPPT